MAGATMGPEINRGGTMTRTAALAFMASLWSASHAYGAAYALEGCLIQMCTCVAIRGGQGEN